MFQLRVWFPKLVADGTALTLPERRDSLCGCLLSNLLISQLSKRASKRSNTASLALFLQLLVTRHQLVIELLIKGDIPILRFFCLLLFLLFNGVT